MLLKILPYFIIYSTYRTGFIDCCLTHDMRSSLTRDPITRFLLHTSPTEKIILNEMDLRDVKFAKSFKIIAHGYTESTEKNYVPALVHAYYKRGDYSIILVDWAELAANEYYIASVDAIKVAYSIINLVDSCRTIKRNLNKSTTPNLILFTSPNTSVIVTKDNVGTMTYAKPFKFLCHGWIEDVDKTYLADMTAAYFANGNYSVVHVDWGDWAQTDYYLGSLRAANTGNMLAEFIVELRDKARVSLDDIHIIGHSMGCYVASAAGQMVYKLTKMKVARVTGLDPAGPLYEGFLAIAPNRMSPQDGKVVDVIHTDNGWFGVAKPTGTIDFYPNGGYAHMPGCRQPALGGNIIDFIRYPIEYIFCSHKRSHLYFTRSINHRNITAVECFSWEDFVAKKCEHNRRVKFGEDLTPGAKGTFFLQIE